MAGPPDGMSAEAWAYVIAFTIDHEGDTPFMYNNWPVKNPTRDVTVGVGIALFSENDAAAPRIRSLFTVKATGQPASDPEMRSEFRRVYDIPRVAKPTNLWSDYRDKSPLRMDPAGMRRLLEEKMLEFWNQRNQPKLTEFAALPAQAQVALVSYNYGLRLAIAPEMCLGASRNTSEGFLRAAAQSRINGWDEQKNAAHKRLFENAAAIVSGGLDPKTLPPVSGPFKPPPAIGGGKTTFNTPVSQQLAGKWAVTIGGWKGFFLFDAQGGVSWTESGTAQKHPGRWSVTASRIEWKFRDPGDFRTFVVQQLNTAKSDGTILPAGQGWFSMSKVGSNVA